MRTPMAVKTKVTLAVGFATFLVGTVGAAYIGSRQAATPSSPTAPPVPVPTVLSAAQPVSAGMAGSSAIAQGLIGAKRVPTADVPVAALTDPTQLSGRVAVSAIAQGLILTEELFPEPQTRIGTVVI